LADKLKDLLITEGAYLMVCGNKNSLGKSVMLGLTEGDTQILNKDEL